MASNGVLGYGPSPARRELPVWRDGRGIRASKLGLSNMAHAPGSARPIHLPRTVLRRGFSLSSYDRKIPASASDYNAGGANTGISKVICPFLGAVDGLV